MSEGLSPETLEWLAEHTAGPQAVFARFAIGADREDRQRDRERVEQRQGFDEGYAFQMRQAGVEYGIGPAGVFRRAMVFAEIDDQKEERRRQDEIAHKCDGRIARAWARGGPRSYEDILWMGSVIPGDTRQTGQRPLNFLAAVKGPLVAPRRLPGKRACRSGCLTTRRT